LPAQECQAQFVLVVTYHISAALKLIILGIKVLGSKFVRHVGTPPLGTNCLAARRTHLSIWLHTGALSVALLSGALVTSGAWPRTIISSWFFIHF
jgi:hypothetical protein